MQDKDKGVAIRWLEKHAYMHYIRRDMEDCRHNGATHGWCDTVKSPCIPDIVAFLISLIHYECHVTLVKTYLLSPWYCHDRRFKLHRSSMLDQLGGLHEERINPKNNRPQKDLRCRVFRCTESLQ